MKTLGNVPQCTQGLHGIGLIVATNQSVLFWLQHEWDLIFTFNKLLHEMNNYFG